jgi:biotin-(acetyl-CoA carboxylase) ligase
VRLEWLGHCAHIGQTVRVATGSGVIAGEFDDLGHDGALVIRADDGTVHRVTTGDVELTGRL